MIIWQCPRCNRSIPLSDRTIGQKIPCLCSERSVVREYELFGEIQWESCKELEIFKWWINTEGAERKQRLFACACCREIPDCLVDERSRAAVEVAERFSDGLANVEELDAAHERSHEVYLDL